MSLSEICIKRPVFSTVLSLALTVLGLIFFTKLQVRGLPDVNPPVVTVSTYYPGSDAFYMAENVTALIENAVKNVKNVDYVASNSSAGASNVNIIFELSADINLGLNDVRSQISRIASSLPSDINPPEVSKMDSDAFPSIWLTVGSDIYDSKELTSIAFDRIINRLNRLGSVGSSVIYGGDFYVMKIEPDIAQAYKYGLSGSEIEAAVKKQNKDYPAGFLKTEAKEFSLALRGWLRGEQDFRDIIISNDGKRPLKLGDISKVYLDSAEKTSVLRYNGKNTIAVGVIMQSKANILDLSKEVAEEVGKIKKSLPAGIAIEVAHDSSVPVRASVDEVFKSALEALVLVVGVTYLFLGSAKITLIPFVTVPLSLVSTFTVMYFLGFSLNTFSLLAMILAVGLVVDDAIVVLENVFRHYESGLNAFEASFKAVKEVSFAVVAMTITLSSVFLPVGFIEGFAGKLFIEFAWTLAFCVLFSGFVALTLTPTMCARFVGTSENPPRFIRKFEFYLKSLQNFYINTLESVFENKRKFLYTIASSLALLAISFYLVKKVFVPTEDMGFLQVHFSGPDGSGIEETLKSVEKAEEILSMDPDVKGYFSASGWGSGSSAFAFVTLKDWSKRYRPQGEIKNSLNQKFSQITGMSIFALDPRTIGSGGSDKPVEFNLRSSSLGYEKLAEISELFVKNMSKNPAFSNAEQDFKTTFPTLNLTIDKDTASFYGIGLYELSSALQYSVTGKKIDSFRMGDDIYDVIIRYPLERRKSVASLGNIVVKSSSGVSYPLSAVADIKEIVSAISYNRYRGAKSVDISSDLNPGYSLSDAVTAIGDIASEILDPKEVELEYLGEIKRRDESGSDFLYTFLFALVFIYLTLSAQFESFKDPLLILLSVPFSVTGGVFALLITGGSINLYSDIGLVTLIGLVTKNSIMIVEFANRLSKEGMKISEAVIEASRLRFRPILMTTAATLFGSVPLAFASGAGAAARNSIGITIFGGLLVGTLFTLFVIPFAYRTFKKDAI